MRSASRRDGLLGALIALGACGGPAAVPTPVVAARPAPTCAQVAPAVDALVRHSDLGADRARAAPFTRAMKAQLERSCAADGWSPALRACVVDAHGPGDFATCDRLFTPVQRRRFAAASAPIVASTLPAAAPAAIVADGEGTGVPECDAYVAAIERYAACDKVPPSAREAMRASSAQVREAFRTLRDAAPEARRAAAEACTQAVEAFAQSFTAMGCAP